MGKENLLPSEVLKFRRWSSVKTTEQLVGTEGRAVDEEGSPCRWLIEAAGRRGGGVRSGGHGRNREWFSARSKEGKVGALFQQGGSSAGHLWGATGCREEGSHQGSRGWRNELCRPLGSSRRKEESLLPEEYRKPGSRDLGEEGIYGADLVDGLIRRWSAKKRKGESSVQRASKVFW